MQADLSAFATGRVHSFCMAVDFDIFHFLDVAARVDSCDIEDGVISAGARTSPLIHSHDFTRRSSCIHLALMIYIVSVKGFCGGFHRLDRLHRAARTSTCNWLNCRV